MPDTPPQLRDIVIHASEIDDPQAWARAIAAEAAASGDPQVLVARLLQAMEPELERALNSEDDAATDIDGLLARLRPVLMQVLEGG